MSLTQKVEGIFNVESGGDGYATTTKKTAEGTLREVSDKNIAYRSTAHIVNRTLEIRGVSLEIENDRGRAIVDFPSDIILAKKVMIGQQIKYSHNIWSSQTEGTSNEYILEILTGPLAGELIERKALA